MRPDSIPRRVASLRVCPAAALILALLACAHARTPLGPAEAPVARSAVSPAATGPNFLLIITDDQRYDAFHGFMPITEARIAQQGVEFTRAYATTPLCCPSRSSILTGMYARNHGVTHNGTPLNTPTFANYLHDAGYFTAHIGKYLNSWNGNPRPEYDFWVGWGGAGEYMDPNLQVNKTTSHHSGYLTHILRDYALTAIDQAVASGKPFMIYVGNKAPHDDPIPAPEDVGRWSGQPPHNPPNFNEADISDKPSWLPSPLAGKKIKIMEDDRIGAYETLWSVDQANGALLDRLAAHGVLDNTFVLFMSDNGYMWGEHRLINQKNLLYEESARVPFAVRYPPLISAPRVEGALIANIDIAPTIYDLAGIPLPAGVDGVSMVPLLQSGAVIHGDIDLETWNQRDGGMTVLERGVHTGRYVYVERPGYISELYDLDTDPYQLQNLSQDSTYAALASDMRARMNGGGGPPPPPPPPAAQCGNGLDDDADGKTDYPADPGCTSSSDGTESPDPAPPPSIALTAIGEIKDGRRRANLTWTGATGTSVEVWRDGARVGTVTNDGQHYDRVSGGATATYRYRICLSGGTPCSNEASVTF